MQDKAAKYVAIAICSLLDLGVLWLLVKFGMSFEWAFALWVFFNLNEGLLKLGELHKKWTE